MTQYDDSRLADWMAQGPHHGPARALNAALARASNTNQWPAWLVNLTGGTIAERPAAVLVRYAIYAIAVVLLTGLLVGALVAGGVLPPRPAPPAPPIPAISSAEPTASVPPTRLVAYTVTEPGQPGEGTCPPAIPGYQFPCTTTQGWVAASDGSGARELPGTPLGWSADGSRLLVEGATDLILTDAGGSTLATFQMMCSNKGGSCPNPKDFLCAFPCTMGAAFALSPDGTRVAFVRGYANDQNSTVVAILDLSSGSVTELASTRTTNPPTQERCYQLTTCEGEDGAPRWSPDGTRIAFERQTMSPDTPSVAWTSAALFVVDANGGNLRRVTPPGLYAFNPAWSPDGTRLVFTNTEFVVNANHTSVLEMKSDVYTIHLDGTNLARLTTDGISSWPSWTADGRLVFVRHVGDHLPGGPTFQVRIMDADGSSNQIVTHTSLAKLTDAGCLVCSYPSLTAPDKLDIAYWQP